MSIDLKKFWILVLVVFVLGTPVGAVQVSDLLTGTNQVSDAKAYNMNIKLHSNNIYEGKLNATGAKTYNIVKKPEHGTLTYNKTSGKFVYCSNKNFVGTDSFTYNVNNGKTNSNTATVTINLTNQAPITKNVNLNITHNTDYSGTLKATDADNDKLTYKIASNTTHGTLISNSNGTYTYTPNINFVGTDSFTYVANDGITNSNPATVTINLNNTSPVVQDTNFTVIHGKTYMGMLNACDNDCDNLTYRILYKPGHGTLNLNSDGTYNYTANETYKGSDIFTYVVNDGIVDSNTVIVRINVTNTRPVANNVTVSPSQNEKLSGSDTDGDVLTYIITSQPQKGTLTYDKITNTYTYTPNYNFDGSDSFSYLVNDGFENSENATVKIYMT